ncbi:MAG: AraC family transcriptional regulator [Betaproteobacteria bacterium]|nr:AraC family transcriptional regulator [Betaproteobacteria bacterium]
MPRGDTPTTPCDRQGPSPAHRSVLLREKRYPPVRIAIAVDTLAKLGAPVSDLLRDTGLSPQDLQEPQMLVSSLQLLGVLRNAVALNLGPDIGLQVGQRFHASCYGMLGYAMLCAPTLRAAFDTGRRYYRLGNGMLDADWLVQGDAALWRFSPDALNDLPGVTPELTSVLRDLCLASTMTVFKDVMGPWCLPQHVAMAGQPPIHAKLIEAGFACSISFDSAFNDVVYPVEWLERAPQLANPLAAAQVSQECARLLDQFNSVRGDTTRHVIGALTASPGHFPSLEAVASGLFMTSRTLRRKLDAEGTSFSELLDEVRHALAKDYLRRSHLTIEDIAVALDFSDTVSFRRAYKRWAGQAPSTMSKR